MNLAPSMHYYPRKRGDQPALELMRTYAEGIPAQASQASQEALTAARASESATDVAPSGQ